MRCVKLVATFERAFDNAEATMTAVWTEGPGAWGRGVRPGDAPRRHDSPRQGPVRGAVEVPSARVPVVGASSGVGRRSHAAGLAAGRDGCATPRLSAAARAGSAGGRLVLTARGRRLAVLLAVVASGVAGGSAAGVVGPAVTNSVGSAVGRALTSAGRGTPAVGAGPSGSLAAAVPAVGTTGAGVAPGWPLGGYRLDATDHR